MIINMDNETYEALKRVVELLNRYIENDKTKNDFGWKEQQRVFIKQVEGWIDGMGKKYCPTCGELNHRCKPNN